ncbi:MAG: hypothetical protein QOC84_1180 [Bradyrhizobium sp.]|jgi:hypothetical protein|nr:hypothetical protein [Bradyrhizobium sp.]
MDLAGGTPLIIRRLIVPLTVVAFTACAVQASAQGAFPAPLPGQAASPFPPVNGATPANNSSPFPPVNGAAPAASFGQPSAFPSNGAAPISGGAPTAPMGAPPPGGAGGPSEVCMKGFMPLREEAEKRGKVIKAAMERKAPAEETCKLIEHYSQAELKMMNYVKLNQTKCNIPPQISEQMKKGHEGTQATLKKCNAAAQAQARGPAGPSLSEVLGSSAALPEATTTKKGGSTFDTLNGNVLAR